MPVPIRRVKDIEHSIPGTAMNPGGAFSPLQRMFLGLDDGKSSAAQQVLRLQPISKVDVRDSELLHKIWLANDSKWKASKEDDDDDIEMDVPPEISDYDVIRLKTSGLVVGRGRNVSFTDQGDKIVRKKILEAASTFDIDRTRDKFDPEAVRRNEREANGRC